MKLHLPKALAAAVMALFAIPNALAETVTMGGTQYEGTTVLAATTTSEPQGGDYVFFNMGTNTPYTVTSSSDWVCTTSKTLMAGSAISGETTYNPSTLYVDASSGTIAVGANLIVGSTDDNADVLHFKGSNTTAAVLNGQVSVVNTLARIWNEAGTNYMQGMILAEGKTIKVVGTTAGAVLRLAGGGTIGTLNLAQDGGSVTLSATKHDGATAASSKEYTITTLNSADSSAALTVESGVTLNLTNLTAGKLINEGTLNLKNLTAGNLTNEGTLNLGGTGISWAFAGQGLSNAGTLNVLAGTTVNLDSAWLSSTLIGSAVTTTVESEGGTVTNPANGFGKISSFELSSLIAGTVNVESGVSWTEGQNALTYSDGVLSYGAGQSLNSTIYQINDAEAGYNLTGATSVVIGATNGTVSLTAATSLDITVNQGAILDINGKECEGCDLVLAGGTLKNSGNATSAYHQQFFSLTLTADSEIQVESSSNQYGIIRQGYGSTFIDLGGHTLTKTGDGNFFAATANLRGGGILKIQGGTFTIGLSEGGEKASIGNSSDTENTNIWFTGNGRLNSGKGINLNKDVEFLAKAEAASAEDVSTAGVTGTISAALDLMSKTATFKADGVNDKLIISDQITNSSKRDGSVVVEGSGNVILTGSTLTAKTVSGSGQMVISREGEISFFSGVDNTSQTISCALSIDTDSTLNLAAGYKLHAFLNGTLTGDGALKTSCATTDNQIDGYRATVISGDASGFTGEWLLETASGTDNGVTSNRRVSGVLNTGTFGGVVKFTGSNGDATKAGSQLLLAQNTSIAGLEGSLTNAVVKGITYPTENVDVTLREMGNNSFTATARNLTITGNKNLSFSGKVDSLVSLIVGDGTNAASQTFDGAKIGGSMELKKQATVTATGNTTIATLKGTGTLTASSGAYSEVKDASSFTGTLTATDDATLQVGKVDSLAAVHSSSSSGVALSGSSSTVTVDEMVLAATWVSVNYSKSEEAAPVEATVITGSLTVSGTSTSTLYANLELKANGTLQLDSALAMGSTLTLNSGITLANTGYVHISDITKNTEITLFSSVNSVTYGAASTALTDTEVDAHNVFGNLNTGDFTIRFVGGDVILKANNNVPEPTTATLSLLALMGLAARRRRKAAK